MCERCHQRLHGIMDRLGYTREEKHCVADWLMPKHKPEEKSWEKPKEKVKKTKKEREKARILSIWKHLYYQNPSLQSSIGNVTIKDNRLPWEK
jgi:hypothetical protein